MNTPDKIRVVGRRDPSKAGSEGLKGAENLLRLLCETPGGQDLAPRGVYRFKTHEEADEWLMKMLTRPGRGRRR